LELKGGRTMNSKEIIPEGQIADRKSAHVRLCLEEDVAGEGVTSGFENYRFRHQALPELDFAQISSVRIIVLKN